MSNRIFVAHPAGCIICPDKDLHEYATGTHTGADVLCSCCVSFSGPDLTTFWRRLLQELQPRDPPVVRLLEASSMPLEDGTPARQEHISGTSTEGPDSPDTFLHGAITSRACGHFMIAKLMRAACHAEQLHQISKM